MSSASISRVHLWVSGTGYRVFKKIKKRIQTQIHVSTHIMTYTQTNNKAMSHISGVV